MKMIGEEGFLNKMDEDTVYIFDTILSDLEDLYKTYDHNGK